MYTERNNLRAIYAETGSPIVSGRIERSFEIRLHVVSLKSAVLDSFLKITSSDVDSDLFSTHFPESPYACRFS